MKYWEIIAKTLSKAGWSWGCVSTIQSQRANNLDCWRGSVMTESVSLCEPMKS